MTQASPSKTEPTTTHTPVKPVVVTQATTNEWGQIVNLEPHATYFVVRRPTPEFTREQSKRLVEDIRGFLHEQRALADRQMKDLNEKYGEPAKAKLNEVRSTLEKRFDEIAKELETRVEKIETDLNERGIIRTKPNGETPGEMPR